MGKKADLKFRRKTYERENIRLRDLAGRQQRWMSNIGMTRDEPGIQKSRWPSPPGAENNLKNYLNDLKSYNFFLNSAAEPVTSVRRPVCRRQTISPTKLR